MSTKYLIYGLKDPISNEIRYIGKSSSGLIRAKSHGLPSRLDQDETYKGRWIKSLRAKELNYTIEVLEETDATHLASCEIKWIAYGRKHNWKLTNLTNGGEGISGFKQTDSMKRKLSVARKGVPLKPEHAKKAAEARRGKGYGFKVGHKPNPETIAKASAKKVGKGWTLQARVTKVRNAKLRGRGLHAKPTLRFNLLGNI